MIEKLKKNYYRPTGNENLIIEKINEMIDEINKLQLKGFEE